MGLGAMVPMAPKGTLGDGANTHGLGAEYGRERLAEGQAPMAPPNLGFVLVSFTRKFTDILGIDCLVN